MSRIAKKPIFIPDNIFVKVEKNKIFINKKELTIIKIIPNFILVNINNNIINLKLKNYCKKWYMLGTYRSILNNIFIGLSIGFEKKLILVGIGYKAYLDNNILFLNIGYSHIIKFNIPKNIEISCPSSNEILVKGYNKELVGQVAAIIRSYRPPEPYRKGKGIRYLNEIVRIKENKKKSK